MLGGLSFTGVILVILSVLVSMVVHEAAHAYVGLRLGDDTAAEAGRISLNPLRHIDPLTTVALPIMTMLLFGIPVLAARPVPFNPERVRFGEFGAALIALAGPVANLLLATVAALVLRLAGSSIGSLAAEALFIFISLNIALFIFNLIPIPPLDGSRVLYAFAPEPLQQIMRQIEPVGIIVVFVLVLFGGFGNALVRLNEFVLNLLVS